MPNQRRCKVYFLGSGTIAVPVLEALLHDQRIELVGVGTQPDRPSGRRRELHPTPLGSAADGWGFPAERIASVNTRDFLDRLNGLAPDIVLVVSFGQLLKDELLNLPRCACVNIHGSLLPRYRGASPITAAIANLDAVTGVTFMQMERGLDTGSIYRILEYAMTGTETAASLELRLGELAAQRTAETLLAIAAGKLPPVPQDHSLATTTRKMKKDDGRLVWSYSALALEAMVRAFQPWPGAFFSLERDGNELVVSVLKSRVRYDLAGQPGEMLLSNRHGWVIGTGEGSLEILELVIPGRKPMTAAAFWNGNRMWNDATAH